MRESISGGIVIETVLVFGRLAQTPGFGGLRSPKGTPREQAVGVSSPHHAALQAPLQRLQRKEASGKTGLHASEPGEAGASEIAGGMGVVELEVLLPARCVDLGYGSTRMKPAALTGPSGTSQTPKTRGLRQPGGKRRAFRRCCHSIGDISGEMGSQSIFRSTAFYRHEGRALVRFSYPKDRFQV